MDVFNVVAGIITIASFVFALILYIIDKALKKRLESGLLTMIGQLDKIAAMEEYEDYDKLHMGVAAAATRDHAISLLKSFSNKEERFKTYDFGIYDEEIEERIRKRKESHGISYGGCILPDQQVMTSAKFELKVNDLKEGSSVIIWDEDSKSLLEGTVNSTSSHKVQNYLLINDILALTANHKIMCRDRNWMQADKLTIGDEILTSDLEWKLVHSICLVRKHSEVRAIATTGNNLFVNGYLVHNEEGK